MKSQLSILCSAIIFTSCNVFEAYENKNPNFGSEYVPNYQMDLVETISFPLDSMTPHMTTAARGNSAFYSFKTNSDIQLFDYETKRLEKKIPLPVQGITNFHIRNMDSIILFDYAQNTLELIDVNANKNETKAIRHQAKYSPAPLTGISPLILDGKQIFISGNMSGEYVDEDAINRPTLFAFDLSTNQVEYLQSYPAFYNEHNWGGALFRWVYITYNETTHTIVMSYPADHEIHTYNLFSKTDGQYNAGSRYIESISSVPQSKLIPLDIDGKTRHFVENDSYSNICYDPYEDVYYRIAEFKTSFEGPTGWKKKISIIVLDKNFNTIGETKIGDSHINSYRYTLFVNNKGLHIQQESDENQMLFNIYKLNRDEK